MTLKIIKPKNRETIVIQNWPLISDFDFEKLQMKISIRKHLPSFFEPPETTASPLKLPESSEFRPPTVTEKPISQPATHGNHQLFQPFTAPASPLVGPNHHENEPPASLTHHLNPTLPNSRLSLVVLRPKPNHHKFLRFPGLPSPSFVLPLYVFSMRN